ncbi:MAG TPA: hypothetical protein VLL07_06515, partial [Pontiella sp.]|nr:hypothetical protein [Pontiella sp.]
PPRLDARTNGFAVMNKVIIGIHGLGNKPRAALLHEWWLNAMHEGLERIGNPRQEIPFKMVYWADVSFSEPLDPSLTDPEDPLFVKEPYAAGPACPTASKPQKLRMHLLRFIEEHIDRLFLNKNLTEKFPGASAKIIEHYFEELNTYYTHECVSLENKDCSAKGAIQARLRGLIEEHKGCEIMLMAHSMGSIIAFDVLSNPSVDCRISTFVTMGSPLGMPPIVVRNFGVQKALHPELSKPEAPHCITKHWYNLSDRRDTIALDHTLRDDYRSNRNGIKAIDLLLRNDYRYNGEANPHKSFGYLRARETAGIIDAFLSGRA